MAKPHCPRYLGSEIPSPLLTLPAQLLRVPHRLLHRVCLALLRRPQRVFQHVPSRSHAALGPCLYP